MAPVSENPEADLEASRLFSLSPLLASGKEMSGVAATDPVSENREDLSAEGENKTPSSGRPRGWIEGLTSIGKSS